MGEFSLIWKDTLIGKELWRIRTTMQGENNFNKQHSHITEDLRICKNINNNQKPAKNSVLSFSLVLFAQHTIFFLFNNPL